MHEHRQVHRRWACNPITRSFNKLDHFLRSDIDYFPLDPSLTKDTQLWWNIASTGLFFDASSSDSGNGGDNNGGGSDNGNGGDSGNGGDDGNGGDSGDDGSDSGDDDGDDDDGDDGGDDTTTPQRLRKRDSSTLNAVIDSGTTLVLSSFLIIPSRLISPFRIDLRPHCGCQVSLLSDSWKQASSEEHR